MPGRHFVRFDSTEDLLEKVDFYLRNEDHRARIAGEGQAAAHGAHTYAHRLRDALEVIGKPRTHQRLFGLNATARDIGAPLQCIVLATDGNLSRLQNAIEMLRLSSSMPSDLIITHFPNPELARWLDQKGVRHRQVARERGAAGLFNQGVREFPGEYFVFVRDEVLPTPNVTQRLIARLEAAPAYGAVGPALNRPRSRQCFQASVSTARELIDLSRALYIREPRHLEEVPTLDPSCFAVRRDALERAGNLDERTTSGTSALDDFCRRLRAAGWRAGWTRSAFVYLPGPGR
jgi:cellulose synthase/poly-beta-1,6-N-acetylglucosamine synthase-like glycosyltransferase